MSVTAGIFTAISERNSEGTVCRLCMKNNNYYYNIFTSSVAYRITVEDALNDLIGLQVAVGDGLPTTLCPLCLKKLTELSVFKMTCLESDARLRKISGSDCLRSIQGDEASDDELRSSADTKDFIEDEIQGSSGLTCSVQRTEIYIPVSDSQQPGANMLETLKEENEDPLSEGKYPEIYTLDPAGISRNALDPLATDELSGMGTCGSPSVKADHFSDDGVGYAHNNSTNGATNDLVSQASDQVSHSVKGSNLFIEDVFDDSSMSSDKDFVTDSDPGGESDSSECFYGPTNSPPASPTTDSDMSDGQRSSTFSEGKMFPDENNGGVSSNATKRIRYRDLCFYCEEPVLNFARHIQRNHPYELEVQKILSLEKNSRERKNLITSIRKREIIYKIARIVSDQ